MQRRALLTSLAGGTVALTGCSSTAFSTETGEVYNQSGMATIRPLDEPILQHGMSTDTDQYLYARVFHPGDTLPVTDNPDAAQYAEAVEDLSEDEFALFTNLRTAAAVPAHFWPTSAEWEDGRLGIELERRSSSYDGAGQEAVGVALTRFEYRGDRPAGADVRFPGGATFSVGQGD